MYETMKIIHMLALMGGGAAMIGNGILMKELLTAEGPPPEMVKNTMRVLGMVGLASIFLLWISGGFMSAQFGYGLDALYSVKLIGATLVLGAVSLMSFHTTRAESTGSPPNAVWLKRLATVARFGVLVAVAFAVFTFN